MAQMSAAEQITSNPFTGNEAAFKEPMVKEEYERLCRDHNGLVTFGVKYGEFDPLGKLAFLNEVEKIQERWDIFFARFSLMNAIDPVYKKQCDAFLQSMNMTEESYRELLKKCHDLMRKEAEDERNQPFLLQWLHWFSQATWERFSVSLGGTGPTQHFAERRRVHGRWHEPNPKCPIVTLE